MQISPFLIYLWQLADNVHTLFVVIAILMLLIAVGCIIETGISGKSYIKGAWKAVAIAGVSALLAAITPSSKTIAMMVIIPSIANSSVIQKDVPEIYKFAVDALKAQLQEAAK